MPLPARSSKPTEALYGGVKIAITPEAWNYLKTGVAAALAVLLVVLVFALMTRH